MRQTHYPSDVATNVRVALARKNLRQGELAERIGMAAGTLGHRLQGRTPFTLAELGNISDALNVSVTELTGRSADNSGKHTVSPAQATVTPEAEADGPTRDQSARLPRDAA